MFCCSRKTEARVVDHALVVSIKTGDSPVIWRAEMSRLSNANFSLSETKDGVAVVLKDSAGGTESVGVFDSRKEASDALEIITDALMGKGRGGVLRWLRRILCALGILFIACVVFFFVAVLPTLREARLQQQALMERGEYLRGQAQQHQQMQQDAQVPVGQPVPADELFGE